MDCNTYFIADTHIGFGSRRSVASRGFGSNWLRHEQEVVNGMNRVLNKCKTLYILGDIGSSDNYDHLKAFLLKLNTRKIFLLLGNHDNKQFFQRLKKEHIIIDFDNMYELKYNKIHFTLCHYPIYEWAHFFNNGIHLHGHTHNNVQLGWKSMDVGIDNIGYSPISVTEVIEQMNKVDNVDKYRNKLFLDKRY